MTDERGRLRSDFEEGHWERLTDPLLPLVLLEDAGEWWQAALCECVSHLYAACPRLAAEEEDARRRSWRAEWNESVKRGSLLSALVAAHEAVPWIRARLEAVDECAEHRAALAVVASTAQLRQIF